MNERKEYDKKIKEFEDKIKENTNEQIKIENELKDKNLSDEDKKDFEEKLSKLKKEKTDLISEKNKEKVPKYTKEKLEKINGELEQEDKKVNQKRGHYIKLYALLKKNFDKRDIPFDRFDDLKMTDISKLSLSRKVKKYHISDMEVNTVNLDKLLDNMAEKDDKTKANKTPKSPKNGPDTSPISPNPQNGPKNPLSNTPPTNPNTQNDSKNPAPNNNQTNETATTKSENSNNTNTKGDTSMNQEKSGNTNLLDIIDPSIQGAQYIIKFLELSSGSTKKFNNKNNMKANFLSDINNCARLYNAINDMYDGAKRMFIFRRTDAIKKSQIGELKLNLSKIASECLLNDVMDHKAEIEKIFDYVAPNDNITSLEVFNSLYGCNDKNRAIVIGKWNPKYTEQIESIMKNYNSLLEEEKISPEQKKIFEDYIARPLMISSMNKTLDDFSAIANIKQRISPFGRNRNRISKIMPTFVNKLTDGDDNFKKQLTRQVNKTTSGDNQKESEKVKTRWMDHDNR